VTIFQNAPEIGAQVKRGDIHLLTLPAMEFIAQRGKLSIVPAFVAANKTGNSMENLLVVRRNSGFNSLRALKGRNLAMPPNAKNTAAAIWLNTLLLKEGVRQTSTFFANIIESPKPSQSLMGVFFKKFDGAVVTRSSFETCRTLNPQLGRDLAIIAESRSFAGEVTCLPEAISPQLRQAIHKAAGTLHESSVGKQMITLFQIDRVIPFRPEHLAGLEDLLREYTSRRDAAARSRKH
jgi:ABC-type phosphate/phosphonate transport system substrate-binding protein